jgi:hypothetical protein
VLNYSLDSLSCDRNRTAVLPRPIRFRRSQPGESLVSGAVAGDYEFFTRTRNRKLSLTKKGNGTPSRRYCDPFVGYGVDYTRRVAGT